jgi:hypothetical protein
MVTESPDRRQESYSKAINEFSVESFIFADHVKTCRISCAFSDHSDRTEVVPTYIAMNLYGSLKDGIDLSGFLNIQTGGLT